jgi:hypothetical protein
VFPIFLLEKCLAADNIRLHVDAISCWYLVNTFSTDENQSQLRPKIQNQFLSKKGVFFRI